MCTHTHTRMHACTYTHKHSVTESCGSLIIFKFTGDLVLISLGYSSFGAVHRSCLRLALLFPSLLTNPLSPAEETGTADCDCQGQRECEEPHFPLQKPKLTGKHVCEHTCLLRTQTRAVKSIIYLLKKKKKSQKSGKLYLSLIYGP